MLRAFTPEGGGVLTKLLAWLLVLAVLASAGLFIYVRSQDPLSLGDVKVATNDVLRHASPAAGSDIAYRGGGEVFVATFIKNGGRLPVSLEGLVEAADSGSPYVPVSLQLGTGTDTDPSEAAALTTFRIDPGSSVGVLVTYRANPDLVCRTLPTDPGAKGIELRSFSVRYSSYGIERTQELAAVEPFAASASPDRAECERATAA